MRTLTLVSSTILMTMSCSWAKETAVQHELFQHPRFQRQAPKSDVEVWSSSALHPSLRHIKEGRVVHGKAVHNLKALGAQQTETSDMRTSVKGLTRGRVNEARSKFEQPKMKTATPVSKPKQEERTSWASYFGFESLSAISVSGFFGNIDTIEVPEVKLEIASVVHQSQTEEPESSPKSWLGWVSESITTSMSNLFGEEQPSQTQSTARKSEKVAVQEANDNDSFLRRSFKWANETKNWLAESIWGAPKQAEKELPLSLEDVEGIETIHLPAALRIVLESGYDEQEAGVVEALKERMLEAEERYYGERKLTFDEALRKAEHIQEETAAWREVEKLPRKTRQRRRTF